MAERADAVQLERLTRYLVWLEGSRNGLTVEELRKRDETSDKTVRRVLDTMQDCGWVECTARRTEHNRKYWSIKKTPQIEFSHSELLSLYLGQQMMQPLAGTPLYAGVHSLLNKVRASQPKAIEELSRALLRYFHVTAFGQSDYSEKTQLISDLFDAAQNHRVLTITYQKADAAEPKQYLIHPYAIFYHSGSMYLVALSVEANDIRHFKIDRMLTATETGRSFQMPENWNLQDYRHKSFGAFSPTGETHVVRIRFTDRAAKHVRESKWHHSQKTTDHADGSLTLQITVENLEEIQAWVLSFGPWAKVLAPQVLIENVRRAAMATATQYSDQP